MEAFFFSWFFLGGWLSHTYLKPLLAGSAASGCAKHSSPGLPVLQQLKSSQRLLSQHTEAISPPLLYWLFPAASIAAGPWGLGLCRKLPEALHTVSMPKTNFPHKLDYPGSTVFSLVSYQNTYQGIAHTAYIARKGVGVPGYLTPAIQRFYICYSATISTTLPQCRNHKRGCQVKDRLFLLHLEEGLVLY